MKSKERARPSAPWPIKTIALACVFFLHVPLIAMVVYSFLKPSESGDGQWIWTTEWYDQVMTNRSLLDSLVLSLYVAGMTTIGSTFLGTLGAMALERSNFPGRKVFQGLAMIPLVMPELVLGISLLIWFVLLRVTLGSFSIILAHITFATSYVIVTVRARMKDFDPSLEEAARDLGANPWQVFWKVTLPLIFPGVLSGALMAFTLSFDDFLVAFFTAGVNSDTLPLKIYSMVKFGISPQINALSTIVLVVTFALVFILYRPTKAAAK